MNQFQLVNTRRRPPGRMLCEHAQGKCNKQEEDAPSQDPEPPASGAPSAESSAWRPPESNMSFCRLRLDLLWLCMGCGRLEAMASARADDASELPSVRPVAQQPPTAARKTSRERHAPEPHPGGRVPRALSPWQPSASLPGDATAAHAAAELEQLDRNKRRSEVDTHPGRGARRKSEKTGGRRRLRSEAPAAHAKGRSVGAPHHTNPPAVR